ncbi:hypothetical protein SacglDRAFT_01645 [Saccharomonospora glauca K62]|uniref:Uncharacterized protein n=1 Tax=Saccharomonospora glauca K62 TaxID=928724 RepID=I1D0T6_9PSEU|nr:hypothetical protein SacglDRAFT_01645 [Saccharomonospora glauca K62]
MSELGQDLVRLVHTSGEEVGGEQGDQVLVDSVPFLDDVRIRVWPVRWGAGIPRCGLRRNQFRVEEPEVTALLHQMEHSVCAPLHPHVVEVFAQLRFPLGVVHQRFTSLAVSVSISS